ncbi:MAG: N-sulfoglucosamine sulfohydrolase [Rhodothermales bacterium]|jgi:N-sulfoglucosamine sulfohydrolase
MKLLRVFLLLLFPVAAFAKPNVLIIIGDDVGYDAFGCTGNTFAKTPEVDRLAGESLVFDRFYGTVSQCAPIRAELYTGLFPVNNGVLSNGTRIKVDGVKSVVDHLEPLGYRVGLTGKLHFSKGTRFRTVQGFPSGANSSIDAYSLDGVRSFITETHAAEQAFCLVIGSIHAHHPWDLGEQDAFPAAEVPVPPQYVDTPTTRQAILRHAAEVELLDKQVGDLRRLLSEMSLTNDTLLIFLSEQGIAMPRAKWSIYDKGNRSLAVFHWPGQIQSGRTTAMGQYCDVVPTLIDLGGGEDAKLDGFSLRPVLEGTRKTHRQSVYLSNVNPTWQRAIIRDDWKLVWSPAREHRHLMGHFDSKQTDPAKGKFFTGAWKEWEALAESDSAAANKVNHVTSPDEFELYRIDRDYGEVNNLASNPEYGTKVQSMFGQLKTIMAKLGDPVYAPKAKKKKR